MQRILDAVFLLFHLGLSGRADIDDGDPARELREALLELFAVVVGGGFLDLVPDLRDARLDVARLATAFDDRGGFLLDGDALRLAEILQLNAVELDAKLLGDHLAAG